MLRIVLGGEGYGRKTGAGGSGCNCCAARPGSKGERFAGGLRIAQGLPSVAFQETVMPLPDLYVEEPPTVFGIADEEPEPEEDLDEEDDEADEEDDLDDEDGVEDDDAEDDDAEDDEEEEEE
jgi:hypothetical protein